MRKKPFLVDPKEVVSIEEIAISNMYEIETLIEVLVRKEVVSEGDVLEQIEKMREKMGGRMNHLAV